ncbi:hypothetical protein BGZ65_001901 [Modicella reniformis]|uniref:Chromosome transmission fidelity protein 8 n=1 Tax=Modicella reniformis TaxID=1440133 RepID=A0A9P6MBQ4_9FUNG|nr:hypothetical protein BGZ65_001901 [Modicella reniformis]
MVIVSIPLRVSKEISNTTFGTCLDTSSTVMLEFQGTVEMDGTSWAGNPLGQLTILEGGVKAQLVIGNHRLDGKVIKLDNPLLLIQKQQKVVSNAIEEREPSPTRLPNAKGKGKSTDYNHKDDTMRSRACPTTIDTVGGGGAGGGAEGLIDLLDHASSQDTIHYDTVAIIRQKILFNTMPVPIIHAERRGLTVIKRGV